MTEMVLTSYSIKSYLVTSSGENVAGTQMMSRNKLEHKVSQQFLSYDKFVLSRDMTFMSRWRIHCTMTVRQVNAAMDAF